MPRCGGVYCTERCMDADGAASTCPPPVVTDAGSLYAWWVSLGACVIEHDDLVFSLGNVLGNAAAPRPAPASMRGVCVLLAWLLAVRDDGARHRGQDPD